MISDLIFLLIGIIIGSMIEYYTCRQILIDIFRRIEKFEKMIIKQ